MWRIVFKYLILIFLHKSEKHKYFQSFILRDFNKRIPWWWLLNLKAADSLFVMRFCMTNTNTCIFLINWLDISYRTFCFSVYFQWKPKASFSQHDNHSLTLTAGKKCLIPFWLSFWKPELFYLAYGIKEYSLS